MQKLCLNHTTPSVRNVGGTVIECLAYSRQCTQFTSHLLHSKLFATVDFFNWTTLSTVQIWLLVIVICSKISNFIFIGPGLQTMNRQKLLLKTGLKGRMDNAFSRHKQLTRKVAKMHWRCRRPYWKMRVWLKVCSYFLMSKLQNFLIAPRTLIKQHSELRSDADYWAFIGDRKQWLNTELSGIPHRQLLTSVISLFKINPVLVTIK